jgi:hypothetical protein
MTPTEQAPPDSHLGSDNRYHHKYGFSFIATIEKCPAAERSEKAAKNLKDAGERGTELHLILEHIVEDWAFAIESGKPVSLDTIAYRTGPRGSKPPVLSVPDISAIRKVVEEIKPFFSVEKGMLLGTEERIDLRGGDGEVISFGYYDLFLKLGRTVLIIDHKFVRKEVEGAEKNRQGHALAVSVWQQYAEVDDVVVLFTMPDCGSSIHRFNRTTDELRLFNELMQIFALKEHPFKVIQAGDHCVYCRHRYKCPAAIGTVKTMVTAIEPLAVPPNFAPHLIQTAEDMAILRYWADTVSTIIDAIKETSLEWAQKSEEGIAADVNGQHVEYRVISRALPRKVESPFAVWDAFKEWLPVEAVLSASKVGITDLETAVVAVLSDRLIAEGKTPNATALAKDFSAALIEKGLLTQEEGRTFFLKRVKASARKKKGTEAPALTEGEPSVPGEAQ